MGRRGARRWHNGSGRRGRDGIAGCRQGGDQIGPRGPARRCGGNSGIGQLTLDLLITDEQLIHSYLVGCSNLQQVDFIL